MLSAANGVRGVYAISELVDLGEGEPFVAGHAEDVVGPFRHMLLEALDQSLCIYGLYLGIQPIQPLYLFREGVFYLSHRIGAYHAPQYGSVAVCQFCHEGIGIIAAAVSQLKGITVLYFYEFGSKFPSWSKVA